MEYGNWSAPMRWPQASGLRFPEGCYITGDDNDRAVSAEARYQAAMAWQ